MPSGDMWWARTIVKQTNILSGGPVPGFAWRVVPGGHEFSGVVIGAPIWPASFEWQVEVRSDYFLDPRRMPVQGEPFISLPAMTFNGGLGLAGGTNEATAVGDALCSISFRQLLRWDDDEVASSEVNWINSVRGKNIVLGKNVLAPQKRDYGALFFNLDRTRILNVTLATTFRFRVTLGGVIAFGPLVFGAPQWKVHSLD